VDGRGKSPVEEANALSFACVGAHVDKQGVLKGFDQCINVVLDDSFERVFSLKEPVEAVELGLYIVRGDNMYALSFHPCRGHAGHTADGVCL